MDQGNYQTIIIDREDRVLNLTLNRPEHLNAVNGAMHEELSRVFSDAARDPDSDIIVLTGAGRAFCAGGDIDWMQDAIDNPLSFERTVVEGKQIIFSLLDCEKPIVAKVNGAAVGLGATLALFCDVIFAASDAKFADPHIRVGLVAGDGGAVIWPQLIGYARAKEYLMTGNSLTGLESMEIGLINHAVSGSELDERTEEFVARLRAGPRQAIRWTKTTINIGLKQLAHAIMDVGLSYEMMSNKTEDHQEAVNSFREKRKPSFVGY